MAYILVNKVLYQLLKFNLEGRAVYQNSI